MCVLNLGTLKGKDTFLPPSSDVSSELKLFVIDYTGMGTLRGWWRGEEMRFEVRKEEEFGQVERRIGVGLKKEGREG